MRTMNPANDSESTKVDSALLDRILLTGAVEHLQRRIADAKWQLKTALRCPPGKRRDMHLGWALKALGGIGAE